MSRAGGASQIALFDAERYVVTPLLPALVGEEASSTPNGSAVVISRENPTLGYSEMVVLQDGASRPLNLGYDVSAPAISPDGTSVALVMSERGSQDVVVLSLVTGAVREIATGSSDEFDPAWSPDGKMLVFVRSGSRTDSIVAVDFDSGASVASITTTGHARSPSVGPDSQLVAFVDDVFGNREVVVASISSDERSNVSGSPEQESGVTFLLDGNLLTSAPTRGLRVVSMSGETFDVTFTAGDAA